MKKLISALVAVIILSLTFVSVSAESTGSSSGESSGEGESQKFDESLQGYCQNSIGNFYYEQNENEVTFHMGNEVDFIRSNAANGERRIILACYDDNVLVHTEVIPLNMYTYSIKMNDFTVTLPSTPTNLSVKAYMWDDMSPVYNSRNLSDIPENAYKVKGMVIDTSRSNACLDKDIVEFRILQSDYFENEVITPDGYSMLDEDVYIGNTDIDKHLGELVEAYIAADEGTGEYTIFKYTPIEGFSATVGISDIDLESTTGQVVFTSDNTEYEIDENAAYYINGVCVDEYSSDIFLSSIADADETYGKVTFVDSPDETLEGDGKYDRVFVDLYTPVRLKQISTEDEDGNQIDAIVLYIESDIGSKLYIYNDEDFCEYNIVNEKMQPCDISELENYIGKTIYIGYDYNDRLINSAFFDIILEGAPAKEAEKPETTEGLSSVQTTDMVLKYSDTDKTAYIYGDMTMESGGDMKYDINVDIMSGSEVLAEKTINTDCRVNKLRFTYEEPVIIDMPDGEDGYWDFAPSDYQLIPVAKKPDKAVISFDAEGSSVEDIEIPVISADAYEVYGRAVSCDKENGTVEFRIEKAGAFEGKYIYPSSGNMITKTVYVGNTDAIDHLMEYSKAYILKKENGDYELEYLRSLATTFRASTDDIDRLILSEYGNYLYIYPAGHTINALKYSLTDNCSLIVDGEIVELTKANADKYFAGSKSIVLIHENAIGSLARSSQYAYIKIEEFKEN